MESTRLCIVGCCRNLEYCLPHTLQKLDTIASWWLEAKIIIYENDSKDDSRRILKEWEGEGKILVTEDNLDDRYPKRTQRLAYIRNKLLEYIPPTFDYVLMADLDEVFHYPADKSAFESCFAVDQSWDVMTAMGRNKDYYDIWALRIPGIIEFDCWERYSMIRLFGRTQNEAIHESIQQYNQYMSSVNTLLPVDSAFNIGILCRVSAIKPCCKFVGQQQNGREICEHVAFQSCLRSHGAKIFFNPNFLL